MKDVVDRLLSESQGRALRFLRSKAYRNAEVLCEVADVGGRDNAHRAGAATTALALVGITAKSAVEIEFTSKTDDMTDEQLEALVLAAAEEIKA